MRIKNPPQVRFYKSAVRLSDLPDDNRPEVAFVGRSNAGKSSLINSIYCAKLARVSSTPGKTRTLNFFDVGEHYRVVDMPGYGFAARSFGERDSWRSMVEDYVDNRESLCGVVLVMDIRRPWEAEEEQIKRWIEPRELSLLVALTKSDKISKSESTQRRRELSRTTGIAVEQIFAVANLKREGADAIEDFIFQHWIKPRGQRDRE